MVHIKYQRINIKFEMSVLLCVDVYGWHCGVWCVDVYGRHFAHAQVDNMEISLRTPHKNRLAGNMEIDRLESTIVHIDGNMELDRLESTAKPQTWPNT